MKINYSFAALVLVLLCFSSTVFASLDVKPQAQRRVKNNYLISDDLPKLRLKVDKNFQYVGHLLFDLKDIARVERFVFADADGKRIKRLFIVQFEGFLDNNTHTYRYRVTNPVTLGGEVYNQNCWFFDNAKSIKENPGAESDKTTALLKEKGYKVEDELLMSRFVRVVDEAKRHEVIIYYLENAKDNNFSLAADYVEDGTPTEKQAALEKALTGRSLKSFTVEQQGVQTVKVSSISQNQPPQNELPDTTLGKIVGEWFAVVENGKEEEIKRFVETKFSTNALKNQPNTQAYFRKLHEQSGGLEIIKVTPPAGEFPMSIIVKSKRGGRFARITVGLDRNEQEKLAGLGVDKTENPVAPKLSETTRQLSDEEIVSAIKAEVEKRASAGDFSGVVLVAKGDKILLHTAHGLADVENKIPNGLPTKYHLASVGKMFTAVSIAQLVKAGKLSYEDTVGTILPDFPNEEIKKITIHQLLTHTAGMGTFFWSPGIVPGKVYRNAAEEMSVYKDEKLAFAPGNRWRYSNAGFSLLGAVIEKVSGKTYLEYIRENIFKPLDMHDKDSGSAAQISVLYNQSPDDPLGIEAYKPVRGIIDTLGTGFGGGFLNTGDLFKFARAYRTGKLLDAATIEQIAKGKVSENDKGDSRWGYGIKERDINGELVRGHSGGGRTDVQMLWNSDYTVIVQTNKTPLPATALSGEIISFITKQLQLRDKKATAKSD